MLKQGIHCAYNYLYIHSVWILYTNCLHNVYGCTLFVHQNSCVQNVYKMFVYKIYPTFPQSFVYILHTKCIQNVAFKMYSTFRQTFVYILDTKFSWHSSFDCRNVVYILYTTALYISAEYILYNFCIENLYPVSMWDLSHNHSKLIKLNTIKH